MYSDFKAQAIEYVKQAIEEDKAGNYARAFPLYMNALEYFKTHLKYEKNPKMKEAITLKFTEYLNRAEEIRAVLDKGVTGPGTHGGGTSDSGGAGSTAELMAEAVENSKTLEISTKIVSDDLYESTASQGTREDRQDHHVIRNVTTGGGGSEGGEESSWGGGGGSGLSSSSWGGEIVLITLVKQKPANNTAMMHGRAAIAATSIATTPLITTGKTHDVGDCWNGNWGYGSGGGGGGGCEWRGGGC
ncbi:Zinc ion transmembrane transporter [Capsicum annuum]|nr:Zinc ion transmembrane transporter [Capsicum annuum]